MAKPIRFPRKLVVWLPESLADAFEMLATDELLSVSDHVRLAMRGYLHQMGAVPQARPMPNGRHHQAAE
jgi:hypothetical protein